MSSLYVELQFLNTYTLTKVEWTHFRHFNMRKIYKIKDKIILQAYKMMTSIKFFRHIFLI